eukprot:355471-Chlamydomonas_euryale.AAC.8
MSTRKTHPAPGASRSTLVLAILRTVLFVSCCASKIVRASASSSADEPAGFVDAAVIATRRAVSDPRLLRPQK